MKKAEYSSPEIEIIQIKAADIITDSIDDGEVTLP